MQLADLKLSPFKIKISYGSKSHLLNVEQSYLSENKEIFTASSGGRSIQIQSNRPLIKANPNSKKKPDYKAINARLEQADFFRSVISAIQEHIKGIEKRPFDWS